MEVSETEIVKYIEPVFHFCVKRLHHRQDAEDLAGEIMVHIVSGIKKYAVDSLDGWVWRIARNRYARFIDRKNKRSEIPNENDFTDIQDDYDFVDEWIVAQEYRQVFKCLHTLSCEYRDIMVDYYIGQLPVKQIAKSYALTETTVKWRLNISREKIKARIGDPKMDKVCKRINWNTGTCNGSMDASKYLYSQISRAICEAAYEKPLTIEEISLTTGIPTLYIEDELPRLINGDAIVKMNGKYATNFIILRLCDKKSLDWLQKNNKGSQSDDMPAEKKLTPVVADIADYFTTLFKSSANEVENEIAHMDFYGSSFTLKRLGYIALSAILRKRIDAVKAGLHMENGPYPPRLDGGYGWFLVDEKESDNESQGAIESGCNITDGEKDFIYYFWLGKYFNPHIYHHGGTCWMAAHQIIQKSNHGIIPDDILTDDDRVRLLKNNLIIKDGDTYRLNIASFTREQYDGFINTFDKESARLDDLLARLVAEIHKCFKSFVPKRLDSQINQWVSCYTHNIIGFVAEELIARNVLEKPDAEKPLTHGVFCILGDYVNV